MLCGSLAIPALTAALPKVPLAVMRAASGQIQAPAAAFDAAQPLKMPATVRRVG